MEGFVKNKSVDWAYAMKRSIRPGGEVPLSELYEQYGEKHGIEEGEPFVDWLLNVKLKGKDQWKIIYDFGEDVPKSEEYQKENEPAATMSANDKIKSKAYKDLTTDEVANLSVRKAREALPNITDLHLLKYALAEARQLQDKDSLCRILDKRIKDLEIAVR